MNKTKKTPWPRSARFSVAALSVVSIVSTAAAFFGRHCSWTIAWGDAATWVTAVFTLIGVAAAIWAYTSWREQDEHRRRGDIVTAYLFTSYQSIARLTGSKDLYPLVLPRKSWLNVSHAGFLAS